jgi:asparagine synthase (glutamine-hydrolysing)
VCGLAGFLAYGGDPAPSDECWLRAAHEQMRPRGPDGAGLWRSDDGRAALSHRRLAIVDLSDAGHQPMKDPVSGNVIAFNGEIYNYRELRSELESAGYSFTSTSDTEVLLKLYLAHGPDFLSKVRGMYALALYDAKRHSLFLARDPFGIKPLYIADDGRSIRFASQVKAMRATAEHRRPDPAGHVGFFLWGHVPEPFTLFHGIRALRAGTSIVVASDGTRTERRHFDISSWLAGLDPLPVRSIAEAHHVLADALRESVKHHLVADVPVGVFLSSGVDSCTLAALGCEVGARPPTTVTLGFAEYRGTIDDEVPLAEFFARQYGTDHVSSWISREHFEQSAEKLIDAMDQLSIDGVNAYFVCKAGREAGLKVAMSGLGGDELFGGYGSFNSIPRLVRWTSLSAQIPAIGIAFRRASAPLFKRFTSPKYSSLLEYGGTFAGAYFLRHALFMPWELEGMLDPELVRAGWEELQTLAAVNETLPDVANARLKVSALTSAWYLRNQLLRDADWASMAHSLEMRTPFVDVPLWETVSRLVLAGHVIGKREMAHSPVAPLPEAILHRRKTGFSVPLREWLSARSADAEVATARGRRGWASLLYRRAGFSDLLAA